MMKPLILASSSKYRAGLLERLGIPFSLHAPDLDESPRVDETPANLAQRLAVEKARAVAAGHPGAWVIGSDQVPSLDGRILGKPGSREVAVEQLRGFSGKSLVFYTAVALVHGETLHAGLDTTVVRFRRIDDGEIERYLDAEPAYDCAGSFRAEGLGISLFNAIESSDPTALVGLPMIWVAQALRKVGYPIP